MLTKFRPNYEHLKRKKCFKLWFFCFVFRGELKANKFESITLTFVLLSVALKIYFLIYLGQGLCDVLLLFFYFTLLSVNILTIFSSYDLFY